MTLHRRKEVYMSSRILTRTLSILTGVLFTLFFISFGVIVAINWKGLYYHDMKALKISETSGYSEEVIRENYDALIEYCSPFFDGELSFPTLSSSPAGIQHFAEVKAIFVTFYYLLAITLVLLVPLFIFGWKRKYFINLKVSAITTVVLPLLVGLACSINFDQAFVLFHKIFFRNDYWLFDPMTDPIINLLPSEFFLHCAIVIIAIVLAGGFLQYLAYRIFQRRTQSPLRD